MTQYPEIFNGGREFEGFVLRALAGVAYKDATVTMAIKTDGPSLAQIPDVLRTGTAVSV